MFSNKFVYPAKSLSGLGLVLRRPVMMGPPVFTLALLDVKSFLFILHCKSSIRG